MIVYIIGVNTDLASNWLLNLSFTLPGQSSERIQLPSPPHFYLPQVLLQNRSFNSGTNVYKMLCQR